MFIFFRHICFNIQQFQYQNNVVRLTTPVNINVNVPGAAHRVGEGRVVLHHTLILRVLQLRLTSTVKGTVSFKIKSGKCWVLMACDGLWTALCPGYSCPLFCF